MCVFLFAKPERVSLGFERARIVRHGKEARNGFAFGPGRERGGRGLFWRLFISRESIFVSRVSISLHLIGSLCISVNRFWPE